MKENHILNFLGKTLEYNMLKDKTLTINNNNLKTQ